MDPNVQNILLGLLVNGLTAFITQFGRRDSKLLLGEKLLEKIKWEETALQPILQKAAQDVAESIEWQSIPTIEVVCLFLNSPEAEAIVRQIYAVTLSAKKEEGENLASIRREFLTSFYLYTTAYASYSEFREDQLEVSSNILLDTLIEGCEQALNTAIDNGKLSAHEAKSAFRHRIILDEFAALKENVSLLSSQKKPNLKDILAFEEKYRIQVCDRYKYITPPNFDKVRRIHIDKLYVSPSFTVSFKEGGKEGDYFITRASKPVAYDKILSGTFRSVLLGNPGGGKSSFTYKLCYELATHYPARFIAGRQGVTPIYVLLRDYGTEKKAHNYSILDFIKVKSKEDYQLEPPIDAFEYLLLNGRAIVVFDGLDELLETTHRQEISSAVESFCTLYPSVPVLITSREVGYEQAPLDEERFEVFRLAPFSEEQVKEYVRKWFNTIETLTPTQRMQKIEFFLVESQLVPDLCSNPLMLALLCNLYQEENYIPKNRPDVYERCAMMLFERWDRSRGIKALLPFESQIRPAMMYLAYWIYSQEGLRSGVTEDKLVEKTKEYLCERLYEDPDEAVKAAREFIDFCKGRAWVFTNVGSTKNEDLYQFTHQTFLEYFAAAYLFRTHSTPTSMFNALRSRIAKREWDVIAQLAFQIQNKQVEGAGDKLLTALNKEALKSHGNKKWNILSFTVRCLSYIIPSPKTVQAITMACIDLSLAWDEEQITTSKFGPVEIFSNLLEAATENRNTIANCLVRVIIEYTRKATDTKALLAFEIGLSLSWFFQFRRRWPSSSKRYQSMQYKETIDFWENTSSQILNGCTDRLEVLCQKSFLISTLLFDAGRICIDDLIKWHGASSLFSRGLYNTDPQTIRFSFFERVAFGYSRLFSEVSAEQESSVKIDLNLLREIGEGLLSCPPPWVEINTFKLQQILFDGKLQSHLFIPTTSSHHSRIYEQLNQDKSIHFGIFILFATLWETGQEFRKVINNNQEVRSFMNTPEFIPTAIINLLQVRENLIQESKVNNEIDKYGFTKKQQDFVFRWLQREINLVQ